MSYSVKEQNVINKKIKGWRDGCRGYSGKGGMQKLKGIRGEKKGMSTPLCCWK